MIHAYTVSVKKHGTEWRQMTDTLPWRATFPPFVFKRCKKLSTNKHLLLSHRLAILCTSQSESEQEMTKKYRHHHENIHNQEITWKVRWLALWSRIAWTECRAMTGRPSIPEKDKNRETRSCTNAQLSNYKRQIAKIERRCCRRNPSSLAELALTWKAVRFLSHVRRPASVPHSWKRTTRND